MSLILEDTIGKKIDNALRSDKFKYPFVYNLSMTFVIIGMFQIYIFHTLKDMITGKYIPLKPKNKISTIRMIKFLNLCFFFHIAYKHSKTVKKVLKRNVKYSDYIYQKTGLDVYEEYNYFKERLDENNFFLSEKEEKRNKQIDKIQKTQKEFKKHTISLIKAIDDIIEENQNLQQEYDNNFHQYFLQKLREEREKGLLDDNDPNLSEKIREKSKEYGDEFLKMKKEETKDIDEILDKINEYGYGSLTPIEEDYLEKYSKELNT